MATYLGTIGSGKIMTARFSGYCATCRQPIAAGETIRFDGKPNHVTAEGCLAARRAAEVRQASAPATPAAPAIDLSTIRNFIAAAKTRGLKFPKLRVLDVDGTTELSLGLTVQGHNPGSVSVKRNGEYVGLIREDGATRGAITPALAAHLVSIAADPAAAAKRYAVLKCRCSFCGLELTDEGSVEVGYGPVCAKHWGLPHAPKGTKAVAVVVVESVSPETPREAHGVDLAAQLAASPLPVLSSPWTPSPYAGRRIAEAE